ncbi:hypothetical protein ANANG_G00153030 [Anguilla anguilla]|uniref:MAP7 domain containing 3 n=1 Tax=Anguilla anguilla TaxID=7936 RepID=A0A9D3M721_ANGAN|nr:hypothetical protein ANANG_G00153030 [Anguilla anguilla]
MAEGANGMKEMRAQMAAAAQAQADERRSQALSSPGSEEAEGTACTIQIQGARPVIDGAALRIDDKLRVAKERREEQEKQQASRESQILERERKTKQQYERQMEERQKKLEEQRRKEVQRRVAAEEKRKLKQEEEREHYEAVLRRSVERSQKLDQRQKRWSWGGDLTADSGDTGGATVLPPSSPVKSRRKASAEADKRSTSATNLKQQSDSVVNKRLSSSSATIAKSPEKSTKQRSSSLSRLHSNTSHPTKDSHKLPQVEQTGPSQQKRSSSLSSGVGGRLLPSPKIERKGIKNEQARRPPATPPENSTPSRLLTPTKASLARSQSSAALSAGGSDPAVSASPLHLSRGPLRSHSIDRQKGCSDGATRNAQKSEKEKRFSSPGARGRPRPPAAGPPPPPSPSPGPRPPAPARDPPPPHRPNRTRVTAPLTQLGQTEAPSPQPSSRPPPIQRPALTPTGPPTLRKRDPKPKESSSPGQPVAPQPAETPPPSNAPNGKSKDDSSAKAIAGTTSAEAAAKMLSENRRLAREQKEREELLRVQREEEERLRKEEEKRLAEEQRVRRAEEEKRRAEEMKILEEEQARMAEEDRVRLEIEEQEKQVELQKEREEAEARALEEAEKQRQERERIMQQNQQERMLRRKRIEEIMKRTRKTDQNDFKRDDEKGMLDENEEEDSEAKEEEETKEEDDCANGEAEFEAEGWSLPGEGPMAEQGGSMYRKLEMDNKENRSILCERDSESVSPTPKALLVEGSEFLNEGSRMGLLPGLNGRAAPWSLEELIELGVRPKAGPLISADGAPTSPGRRSRPRAARWALSSRASPSRPCPRCDAADLQKDCDHCTPGGPPPNPPSQRRFASAQSLGGA